MEWKHKTERILLVILTLGAIVNTLCIANYLAKGMAVIFFLLITLSSVIVNIVSIIDKNKYEHKVYKNKLFTIIFAIFSSLIWSVTYFIIIFRD